MLLISIVLSLLSVINAQELPGNLTDLNVCKVSHLGLDYMGKIGKTEGNVRCQTWATKNPIHLVHESYTNENFPELSKVDARNYCRNPNKDPNGPWCYTIDPQLVDDTCAIPLCSITECRLTGPGMEYAGSHSKASSDLKCLKWDKNRKKVKVNDTIISITKFSGYKFPERYLSDSKKFCRNPDGDLAGPWCFIERDSTVEKAYCDIPFCDDQDCMVFTKNFSTYSHYTMFPKELSNFTFGLKLWDPDSYLVASARLILTLLPLPVTGEEIDDLGIGIEIFLSNKQSALTFGNKDKPEHENTHGIIKSTEYTFFSISWDRGFLTLYKNNVTKPIFLQELKYKNTLMGFKKNQFYYYSAQGTNIMWSFPFCDDDGECDAHVTTTSKFQQFWPLRETNIGHDLVFYVRAAHSAYLLLVPSPAVSFPNVKIMLGRADNFTRIVFTEYEKAPAIILWEQMFPKLLSLWTFHTFSVNLFANSLHFVWKRDIGTFTIMDVKHDVIKSLRWFAPSSEDGMAYWSFYCVPPVNAHSLPAYMPECALTSHEVNYVGSQDVTSSGMPCLPWSGKKLIPSGVKELFKADPNEIFEVMNYCRNFKHESSGAYCYAISEAGNKRIEKRYCDIRKCKSAECRMAGTGNDYIGKAFTTRSNRTCQYWVGNVPIDVVRKIYETKSQTDPEENLEEHLQNPLYNISSGGNRTMLPDLSQYISKAALKRELREQVIKDLAEISANTSKVNPILKDISEAISNFMNESIDANMLRVIVHKIPTYQLNATLFPDMLAEKADNYCRNPTRSLAGTWCYTMDKKVPIDACSVPDCDRSEECMVFLMDKGIGRDVYILPQWKEFGFHGGLRFSVKQWNPDLLGGLEFVIRSFTNEPTLKLVIGAEKNERIMLYKNNKLLITKNLPHIIHSGKWTSLWLQIRKGVLMLGFEGVTNTLFEWESNDKSKELLPIFINVKSMNGNVMGLFFNCKECHTENTTSNVFDKIMPIDIWTENDRLTYKNLTLYLRGSGEMRIRFIHLPGFNPNYDVVLQDKRLSLHEDNRILKEITFDGSLLKRNSWVLLNFTFSEQFLKISANNTEMLFFNSSAPLLLYYFSIAAGKNSWVTWVANCEVLDIDGPPLDGGWSKWSPWVCTVSCGGGEGYRTRTCSNPRPNIYGHLCEGLATSTGKCNEFECGDLSPDTFDYVRHHLQSTNFSLTVEEGKTLTIYNDADIISRVFTESPDANYEWIFNGKFVKPVAQRIDFVGDNVVIQNAHLNDSGVYICMLYRVNKKRLILHIVTLAVITNQIAIDTRATLPIILECRGLGLGYAYSDLNQKWLLNGSEFIDYGVTTLAAVSFDEIKETNTSLTGIWMCIIEHKELKLKWITNIINIRVKIAPNLYTHLMEDPLTKPIFGRLKYEAAIRAVVIVFVVFIILLVAFGLFAYLKWGRLPDRKNKRKKQKRRQKKEGSEGISILYRTMWRHTKGKKIEVAMKILKSENKDRYLKDFLELAGQWAFLQSNVIVRLFGVTLSSQLSMVLEYVRLGPLDQYLREKKAVIKVVDLIEATSNVASALWHLSENRVFHGNIRCKKLLVSRHDENAFNVKLSDPGIHTSYVSTEVHWIPIECYSNLDHARKSTPADVWAFATTIWEIFMYGESIKNIDHSNATRFYISGKRLPQPQLCPSEIYKLMLECWDGDHHRRKLPQAISRDINQILYQVYNSRKIHSYAKLNNMDACSMESVYSNVTDSTNVTQTDDLVSISEMSEVDADFASQSSLWSGNTWLTPDSANSEDGYSRDIISFPFPTATTSLDSINSMQSIFELDDDCNVILQGRIGQGFYGEVYKGTLEHSDDKQCESRLVAVKKLKSSAVPSCMQDFEREICIMKTLKHPNIVEILGVLREPEILLVMEYVHHGSLQNYLKIYKENFSVKQLLKFALDIAKGMDYLGKKNIVHRDLAARNILVVDENHVKISDFGLAQVVDADHYYILKTDRELPMKWYALESLRDGKFSSRSDVWSYGVTMCEMFSHGEEPVLPIDRTEGPGPEQQILVNAFEAGTRFPCPVNCPQSVYVRIVYPCWLQDPHLRPPFLQLCNEINELLAQF